VLLRFESHILDPARRELTRMGTVVPMEPQVFDLLLYVIRNRHRVVSKDDLIAGVWNGRIVSESTLATRINAARRALGDDGKQQRFIQTIARKGVRFVVTVREEQPPSVCCAERAETCTAALPGVVIDRPSIAVLPFDNLSEERSLELSADGLVEDVIALLARVPGFFVVARASSFIYRSKSPGARQVGTELGARYVVTGSIRGSNERVRVAVQLIEAENATLLWAARYDVERGDTLELQDTIAREIVAELEPALTKAELSIIRRRRTDSGDVWSRYRQAAGAIALGG
jgi:TolB-like protein